ncbi:hypothetical protein JW948_08930 [bacterium]|nr:hypothetical protein [bacterium]
MIRKFTIYFLLNIAIIALLGLIFEVSVRIFNPDIRPQGTDRDLIADSLCFDSAGLKPFSHGKSNGAMVEVDRFGFRKYRTRIDTNKASWLLLGDSVTMGIGVEADSTFAGLLSGAGDSINILNPSLIGYDIEDYVNVFNFFVIKNEHHFTFERVILFWCLNDIYPDLEDIQTPGGKLRSLIPDILQYLRTNSRSFFYLKSIVFDRPKSYYLFDQSFYQSGNSDLLNALNRIIEIHRSCEENHIDFNIVLLPYEYQLRQPNQKNIWLPQDVMKDGLKTSDILIFDFRDHIVSGTDAKKLYLFGDGNHFSNYGHRMIAKSLGPFNSTTAAAVAYDY